MFVSHHDTSIWVWKGLKIWTVVSYIQTDPSLAALFQNTSCQSDPVQSPDEHDAQSGSGVLDRTGVWDLCDGAPQEWHPADLPGGQWRFSLSCCSECHDLIRGQYGGWRVFQCIPQPGPAYIWQCPAQSGPDHISVFFLSAGEFQPQTQSACSYIR